MHLKPWLNSLEKKCLHNLSGILNAGSSGKLIIFSRNFMQLPYTNH